MRRAHDRPSGPQTGAQGAENPAGATSSGTTSGAGATGPATATGTRGMTEQQGGQVYGRGTEPGYGRGTEPTTAYRGAPAGYETKGSSGSGGSLAIVAGLLSVLAGLAIVVRPHYYRTITGYAYAWNGRPWGIILLILGALLFAAGVAALLGIKVARPIAVGLAVLTAIAGFLWLVYFPVWGIVIVAASGFAIWGLHHDAEHEREPL
jgi:hypothetical protein